MSSGLCTFVLLWYVELSMLVCLMETVAFVANFIECYDFHREINCCICTLFTPVIDVSCFVQYFVRPDDLGVVVHMHLISRLKYAKQSTYRYWKTKKILAMY